MFRDSDSDYEKTKKRKKNMSCSQGAKPEYRYLWLILFDWDVNEVLPFSVHKLSTFNDNDINDEWVTKNLGIASRTTKLRNLSPFPGGVYSLIGKIESGK